jgi:alginate O-acetyltransferase complex protein AlgI
MLFNSPTFILFFAIVFCLYWALRARPAQNHFLLFASYIFYGFWSWKFLALLWVSTLFDYACGRAIASAATQARKKAFLIFSVGANLSFLGFFKYYGFFAAELGRLLTALGWSVHPWTLQVVLPIGISFYTFQSMSYVIDVYRGKLKPVTNLPDYALYVAFFPQLVAGPIQRAHQLLPQIQRSRSFSGAALESGMNLAVWGLFKKMVIADNLAPYVDAVYRDPTSYSGIGLITATVFFAFQIYCDFSGYSDCARGVARTLGFDIIINFDTPYFSKSPVEFWRRWHISLSQWFQDYLYFPLAMRAVRRGSWGSKYVPHIISMGLIGFWHGANWTFIAFGLYWGAVLAGYLYLQEHRASYRHGPEASATSVRALAASLRSFFQACLMFVVVCVGWVLFRSATLGGAGYVLTHFFSAHGASHVVRPAVVGDSALWVLVGGILVGEWLFVNYPQLFAFATGGDRRRLVWRQAMVLGMLFTYVVTQQTKVQPFIYFQF